MFRTTGLLLALFLGAVGTSTAQTTLEWKFKEKDRFYVETVVDINSDVEVMRNKFKQHITLTTVNQVTVRKMTNRATVIEYKMESVKVKTVGMFAGEEVDKIAEQLKGAAFSITLAPSGKVEKFTGYEDLVKKIAKDSKEDAAAFRDRYPKDYFLSSMKELFGFLPSGAVAKGKEWKNEIVVPVGPIGKFKSANTYKYVDDTKEGTQIGVTMKMTYTPPKGNGQARFKITQANLRSESGKGTILFDAKRGRLVKSDSKIVVKGSVTMDVQGNKIEMSMAQTSTTSVRVTDRAPSDN